MAVRVGGVVWSRRLLRSRAHCVGDYWLSSDILSCLFCHWSVHVRSFFTCSSTSNPSKATVVKVVPTPNNGSPELLNLHHDKDKNTGQDVIWFKFQKAKYIYDHEEKKQFCPVEFPINETFEFYQNCKGYQEDDTLVKTRDKYGANELDMDVPGFMELFKERATSPFFVFQVFCVGLWCLDDYWYYSLFTLFMLVAFEATLVQQQMKNMKEIRNMGTKPYIIQVYRNRKWRPILSNELLPGDIVSIGRPKNSDVLIPCDLLLLRGSCIVDEAMLTGESVPQMKESVEEMPLDEVFDSEQHSKLHLLSGGTKVVQHSPPLKTSTGIKGDYKCIIVIIIIIITTIIVIIIIIITTIIVIIIIITTIMIVINIIIITTIIVINIIIITTIMIVINIIIITTIIVIIIITTIIGKLLKTILFGVKRVTANNLETFMFIIFLLIFAVSAAAYVWIKGTEDPKRNRYKLFLECTLILTSVVPPELPIELSLAVNSSLIALQKLAVYCTEPFRIPFAGKVDICCFDKTGTLTSDNLVVQGIAGLKNDDEISSIAEIPENTLHVLASCHSLVCLEDTLVGDPLEKAVLHAVDWRLTKGDLVIPNKGRRITMRIMHRYHFSSALKRMSALVSVQTQGSATSSYFAAVKGAPETLRSMYTKVPDNYDSVYNKMTCQGARVLALGFKKLGELSVKEVRDFSREQVECELEFVGFVIIACPLKTDSKNVIKQIHESSHHITMITGDNPLTACHVAKELRITRKETLVMTHSPSKANHSGVALLTGAPEHLSEKKSTNKHKEDPATLMPSAARCIHHKANFGARMRTHMTLSHFKQNEKEKSNDITIVSRGRIASSQARGSSRAAKMRAVARGEDTAGSKQDPQPVSLTLIFYLQKKLQEMLKQIDEMDGTQIVQLGDACIASPFTSKLSSINCGKVAFKTTTVCHIIKQGRCTLVTTLQMFKILALNALILAYSQSVLYLDGIKFSDGQAYFPTVLLAGCNSYQDLGPLKVLSKRRPLPNIFNIYTIVTVLIQFAVHFIALVVMVWEAKRYTPSSSAVHVNLESKFQPTILNSTVYIISIALQLLTFAVNYKFREKFLLVLLADVAAVYLLDRILEFIFGASRLKKP
ncbi:hypothetical protein QZH41_015991 [Actinostola sp. cb2023]|nr:hypothetical protein QZH41_015991 [Actinostola sp. cb2023]